MKTTKILLGFPWYDGPDVRTYTLYNEVMHYFGRLQERSQWMAAMKEADMVCPSVPPLDPMDADKGRQEYTQEDFDRFGVLRFGQADEAGLSLPGLARERLVESALAWGADYLFMWDADMRLPWSALLRLMRHQKPIVAALAFTARKPVQPVIYRIQESYDERGMVFTSETVYDYPRNQLIGNADVDGSLAFGAGVVLYNMNVFTQIPKPWFHSTGCGEDWMFCVRCHQHGVPRYMDTSLKTQHKGHEPEWIDEQYYDNFRAAHPDVYEKLMEGAQ